MRPAPTDSDDAILRVDGLAKQFGAFRALDGVSFIVRPGEILGLVGPNGSGKTTCINVISGLLRSDGGEVALAGESLGTLGPHRRVHQGINRTFQVPRPFLAFTVRENVEVALAHGRAQNRLSVEDLLAFVDLLQVADVFAASLTSVQQKLLDLARALATRPKVLLVDELAAGLNPAELVAVADKLATLAGQGMALVVVEHLLPFIDRVAHRVVVMNAGVDIFHGSLADASHDPTVIEVFLGSSDDG